MALQQNLTTSIGLLNQAVREKKADRKEAEPFGIQSLSGASLGRAVGECNSSMFLQIGQLVGAYYTERVFNKDVIPFSVFKDTYLDPKIPYLLKLCDNARALNYSIGMVVNSILNIANIGSITHDVGITLQAEMTAVLARNLFINKQWVEFKKK